MATVEGGFQEVINIENALNRLVPDPVFYGRLFTQSDYETGITWGDTRPKPAWDELITADAEITAEKQAVGQEKQSELSDIEELRAEYKLPELKGLKLKQLKQAVKNQLAEAGGVNKAIKQLAIAVALLERRVYGKL